MMVAAHKAASQRMQRIVFVAKAYQRNKARSSLGGISQLRHRQAYRAWHGIRGV